MYHPGLAAVPDRNARFGKPGSICVALIPKGVVLRGDDNRGRQPAEVCGIQRAGPGGGAPGRVRDPLLGPPRDIVGRQAPTRGLRRRAGTGECQIGVGVQQDLGGRQRSAFIAQAQAGQRGKVPAGTVTHDEGRAFEPDTGTSTAGCPPDGIHAVIDSSRPRVLRSPAEVDAQHGHAGPHGQSAACPIVRLQIADRPHPSMKEHHQRPERRRRPVEAGPQGSRADRQVLDVGDLGARGPDFSAQSLRTPQIHRAHGTGRRAGVPSNSIDEGCQFGIGERGVDRFGHAGQDAILIRTIRPGGSLLVKDLHHHCLLPDPMLSDPQHVTITRYRGVCGCAAWSAGCGITARISPPRGCVRVAGRFLRGAVTRLGWVVEHSRDRFGRARGCEGDDRESRFLATQSPALRLAS